ncbi:MAG: hypothetical protein UY76_C0065G0006 [Candidatus Uhrbacteria bacterium GW2011_GWA2_52_8d]|uniref:Uncharacterized protein n=1 Tax=Candidatus Uhrbacteria bacterium GW2011_GWA2_52_8d TaxID=1618979 RepID=A0A0G1XIW7_9BACT|nr:MAG: hypothetical protein UY76_C0065G0006 [Candidatus Uhrbacteria bacterium GW2011_GWA2_52_8d]
MNEDKIIEKLLEHDEKFEEMATKSGLSALENKVMTSLDRITVILNRLDEERYFTTEWIRRVEEDLKQTRKTIDLHAMELMAVKQRLAM